MMIVAFSHLLAVILALGASIASASSQLFVRFGTDEGTAHDAVIVGIVVNILVLLPIVALVYYPNYGLTHTSVISFIAAGLVGSVLGRLFSYSSIDKVGASRTAPIVASNALVATVLGIIFLDESLTGLHAIGIVLIVGGVAAIALETSQENPDDLSGRELLIGMTVPFAAAVAYGSEPILANFGFAEGTPAFVGLVIKTTAAGLGFTLALRWKNALPDLSEFQEHDLRWFILAGIANTVFLMGYYGALEIAPVNVVTPLIITNTLFVILLSAVYMPDRLEDVTWKVVVAAVIVVLGALIITILG